jgi:hypothetical protein
LIEHDLLQEVPEFTMGITTGFMNQISRAFRWPQLQKLIVMRGNDIFGNEIFGMVGKLEMPIKPGAAPVPL